MSVIEIKVPDIGDFAEVTVIELMVKPGDNVRAEQSLITVESDKASMEIPSSHAGVVKELRVQLGDKVKEGSLVLMLEVAGAAAAPAAESSEPKQASAPAIASASAPVSVALAAPAPAAAAAVSKGPVEVRVPDIGDFKDVTVIEVLVKTGDAIRLEQSLITVESDKAAMEIPSSTAGVLKELKVKVGDKVNIGDLWRFWRVWLWPRRPSLRRWQRWQRWRQPLSPPPCPRWLHRPQRPPQWQARRIPRALRRWACRTPRPRCASLRVSWACRWPK